MGETKLVFAYQYLHFLLRNCIILGYPTHCSCARIKVVGLLTRERALLQTIILAAGKGGGGGGLLHLLGASIGLLYVLNNCHRCTG